MKSTGIKYVAVLFLLTLFIFKGLVTLSPLFTDYLSDHQEMEMNTEAENTKEKNSEKWSEIKEFLGHSYSNDAASIKYAILSKSTPARDLQFANDVFLPIVTPPPKLMD